ncbi:MAG: hypothetical protein ACQEP3_00500 [Patescibacteria group bacterium]
MKKRKVKRASEILEEIQRDLDFIKKLERRRPEDRIYFLTRHRKEIMNLNNLKRNWLLVKINEFIDLALCPFFKMNLETGDQFCDPDCDIDEVTALKMNSKGITYSADRLKTNCDLAKLHKDCQKFAMLG